MQIDENPDSYPYDKITRLKDKLFSYSIVKTANKVGLLEYETKIVIPLQYDSLDYSVQGETATFTAYRLKEKKIISTERLPIDLRLPPPPSTKSKITWEELLKMEKVPDGEGSALLKRYKNISRVKGNLNKIVIKENNSERYAIFDRYSNQPLELKYRLFSLITNCLNNN
ncbi:hypothetical protein VUJ46_06670 [Chryseobacterium sp. MYb264]|uniref:hypothetical protein n=1 Tax=Chryseobacterium sp. MYb264 TaxID=2745153 RepID=UPI002E0E0FEB|nr:hypothetical protein VUJ46_06670 [Chryseobacterium sp. MYb264]